MLISDLWNAKIQPMNAIRIATIVLLASIIPTRGRANVVYYLNTTNSGAENTIDAVDAVQFFAPSLSSTACLVATCTKFSVSAFDATFNWELGGGNLDIKQNHAADDVTLALWDTTVGATLVPILSGGPFINITGNLVDMVTVPASAVPGTYATTTSFDFATPYTIQAGHSYIATLTSSTPSKSAA